MLTNNSTITKVIYSISLTNLKKKTILKNILRIDSILKFILKTK